MSTRPDDAPGAAPDDDEPLVELAPEEAQRLFEAERGDVSEPVLRGWDVGLEEAEGDEDAASAADSRHDLFDSAPVPRVPGYVVEGVIGRGATGIVYRARQEAVDRPVALKVLHRELITNRRAVKRLKREARLAAKLAHPSIISAIDMGVEDGLWWYAMELVQGVSLSRRIAERGSLTERECLRLFSPLCDALQHAHEMGVVHRDIKPANILIDQRGRARLVDLGLAMGQNDPSITKTGATLGTPHYVSPEQARDPSTADIRSDLWSIGATMYHAVCGRPPFSGGAEDSTGVAEILSRVLYMPIVDPREYAPGLSKGFALLLQKCLTRDPGQRYQEPWELVADIETLRERRRLDLRGAQVDPFASRRPAWVRSAALAGALAFAVAATWLLTARPWEPSLDGAAAAGPRLADWPALRDLAQEYDAKRVLHRGALAELDSIAPGLPEEAIYFENELRTRIKRELRREVDGAVVRARRALDAALEAHDFVLAESIARTGLADELRAITGYDSAATLPAGQLRTDATAFGVDAQRLVDDAHSAALAVASLDVVDVFEELLAPELDVFLADKRYASALAWLSLSQPTEWLRRAGSGVDVRGLTMSERERVVSALDVPLANARRRVNDVAKSAYRRALDALADLERAAERDIDDGLVTSGQSVAEVLAKRVAEGNAEIGFRPEELPDEYADYYGARLDATLASLRRLEVEERAALARLDLARLARDAAAYTETRDYVRAQALYVAAREDAWRESTFEELDLRIRELGLMLGLRAELGARVEALDGEPLRLSFNGIGVTGVVNARVGDVERVGFRFGPRGAAEPLLVRLWTPVDEPLGPDERLLGTVDVQGVLALEERDLSPSLRVGLAALLLAEREPRAALDVLPVSDPPPTGESLVAALEQRIRTALGGVGGPAPEDARGGAPRPGPPPSGDGPAPLRPGPSSVAPPGPASLEDLFGTPNQVESGLGVRLAWDFTEGLIAPEDRGFKLIAALPVGEERLGGWRTGEWRLAFHGVVLDEPLETNRDFFEFAGGPYLPLDEGLDRRRGIRARLWIEVGEDIARGHMALLSLTGYHAVFASGQCWFGSGDLRALYQHIDAGETSSIPDFEARPAPRLVEGRRLVIEIVLRENSLDELSVDGESLGFQPMRRPPKHRDLALRLRSREPMTLLGAEIEATRLRPR